MTALVHRGIIHVKHAILELELAEPDLAPTRELWMEWDRAIVAAKHLVEDAERVEKGEPTI